MMIKATKTIVAMEKNTGVEYYAYFMRKELPVDFGIL